MASNERKPRARKKAPAADAAQSVGDNGGATENQGDGQSAAPTTPADMPSEQDGANDRAANDSKRTTADHMHESMQSRPQTYGEVF
jgi:hypothetical protein